MSFKRFCDSFARSCNKGEQVGSTVRVLCVPVSACKPSSLKSRVHLTPLRLCPQASVTRHGRHQPRLSSLPL
eukprot:2819610-Amphidinium_carterae.1